MKDFIGIIASIFIVFSMVFKTTTFKGTICMRVINSVGSAFFIIYGFWPVSESSESFLGVNAFASGLANSILFLLNIFYIFKECKDYKKEKETK